MTLQDKYTQIGKQIDRQLLALPLVSNYCHQYLRLRIKLNQRIMKKLQFLIIKHGADANHDQIINAL